MRRLMLVIACVCWVTPAAAQRPTVHTTVQTTATTASSLLVGCALGATTGCTGGINSGPIVVNSGGINIVSNVPGDTTMKLYNNSGTLTWNGTPLAAGSSLSGTTGTIAIFTASNAVGNSIITQTGGTTITVTGTLNATTAIQLNGTSINTAGTLSNVAYLNAANTFSNASGQTFAGGIGLSGGSPSTHGIMIPSAVPGITTTNLYNNGGVLTWSGGASFPGNVTVTTLNTYTFNQSLASGASPTLTGTNFTGIPAASILAGTFGSGNYTIPGLLTVSGFGTHEFSAGGTGFNRFDVRNTTAGTGNGSQINVGNNADAQLGQFIATSSTYTPSGDLLASGVSLRGSGAGGVSILASNASGDVRLYSRNALALTLGASQVASFTGNVRLIASTSDYIEVSNSSNTEKAVYVSSNANGTAATAAFRVQNVAYTGYLTLPTATFTTAGLREANVLALVGDAPTLRLGTSHGSGVVQFYSGNTLALTLGASQAASFTGTVTMSYYGAGTATFDASGNITSVSDERQKDIEGPFTLGLNALMGVRPILYRYKASTGLDTENVYAGFSAQNVRDYIPEAIGKNLDGMYSLNIVPMLAAAITAIQELSRELDELRAAANLPAKTRTVAPVMDDARVINSDTPKRRSELAKDNAERAARLAEAEKVRLAAEARQAIRTRLTACDADNVVIVAQGGKPLVCEATDADRAERKAMQTEAAAQAKAAADAAAKRKEELARCEALNAVIVKQGGKPRGCGGTL